jgi:hypothetical protein
VTDGIVVNPQYPTIDPVYGKQIATLYSNLELIYDDDAVSKTVNLQTDTYTPPWLEPPDLVFKSGFPKATKTFANDPVSGNPWIRNGSIFSSTGADVDDVTSLTWIQGIAPLDSAQAVKITNPMPQTSKVVIAGVDGSWAVDYAEWPPMSFTVGPNRYKEYDLRAIVRRYIDAEAAGIVVKSTFFDANLGDNGIEKLAGGNGFYLTYPDVDEKYQIPCCNTIAWDFANIIDQYGPLITGIAAFGSAAGILIPALKDASPIKRFAASFGVNVAELAALFSLGLQNNWLTSRSIAENISLGLIGGGGALASSLMGNLSPYLPSKYGTMIGAAIGGGIQAAGVYALLGQIDNCTTIVEW